MRAFLDTEFTNLRRPDLISLAIVTEAGHEFYAELRDFSRADCSDFVVKQVLPYLGRVPDAIGSRFQTANRLAEWLAALPEPVTLMVDFWGDVELLMALFQQTWQDWPPKHLDQIEVIDPDLLRSAAFQQAFLSMFSPDWPQHHALADARAIRAGWMAFVR